ncbi:MAG TPA: NUDIX domain-containing protein [Nitrososphaeraceae archaeon]
MEDKTKNRIKVVTVFLMYEGKILLLRRSAKVRTMNGMWAGISGYLEDVNPLVQALKEIREECGLSEGQIDLLKFAEPLEVKDEQFSNIIWIVYPFLFESSTKSIRLDWEHDEYVWINPIDLGNYKTVPKLSKALERLLH